MTDDKQPMTGEVELSERAYNAFAQILANLSASMEANRREFGRDFDAVAVTIAIVAMHEGVSDEDFALLGQEIADKMLALDDRGEDDGDESVDLRLFDDPAGSA